MGTALSAFLQFTDSTPNVYITGTEEVLIESQRRSHILSRLLQGDVKQYIQGGQQIKDVVILDEPDTTQDYQPLDTFTWPNPQTTTKQSRPWRFTLVPEVFSDHEIELNFTSGMTRGYVKGEMKNLLNIYRAKSMTTQIEGMEARLWTNAHNAQADMESDTGRKITSIPALINEATAGLPTGWTTVEGINPTTETNWRPTRVLYDYADPTDSNGNQNGLLDAFDEMWLRLRYIMPKVVEGQKFFESAGDGNSRFIACSINGLKLYWAMCRARNDRTLQYNDMGVASPTFNGVDMQEVAALETATLFPASGSTFNTELNSATTTRGPRYWWLDARYLKLFCHSDNFMLRKELPKNNTQPSGNVRIWDSWWNLFARSRKRMGIIAPGG